MDPAEEPSPPIVPVDHGPGAASHGHRVHGGTDGSARPGPRWAPRQEPASPWRASVALVVSTAGPAGAAVTKFGVADPALTSESASARAADLAAMKAVGINARQAGRQLEFRPAQRPDNRITGNGWTGQSRRCGPRGCLLT